MGRKKKEETPKENRLRRIEDFRFLSENAYEILKEAIITVKFAPQEKLNLAKITDELGISATPVREAMNRLIQDGFVVTIPFKGAYVSNVDQKMVDQLAELRELVEIAAIKRTATQFSANDVKAGEALLGKLEKACKENDVKSYVECSLQFHNLFIEKCGNEMMATVIKGFYDHIRRIAFLALGKQESISSFVDDYRRILDALREKNPEKAAKQLRDHLRKVTHTFDQEEPVGR